MTPTELILYIGLGGLTLGCLCILYGIVIEPFRLRVVTWHHSARQFPAGTDLKIALIADPHLGAPWMTAARLGRIVEKVNGLKPDLIFLLGDYVSTHRFLRPVDPVGGLACLKNLRARLGVFAILGNHDFYPGMDGWPHALRGTGLPVLEDSAVKIQKDGHSFWVAGLKDQFYQKWDMAVTLAQVTDADPVILMMHEPDAFADLRDDRVALTVAGHTHGGQVRFPFLGAVYVPSRYKLRYSYGKITEAGRTLIVSGGLGMSGIPARFLNPPEITVIHLAGPENRDGS